MLTNAFRETPAFLASIVNPLGRPGQLTYAASTSPLTLECLRVLVAGEENSQFSPDELKFGHQRSETRSDSWRKSQHNRGKAKVIQKRFTDGVDLAGKSYTRNREHLHITNGKRFSLLRIK